MAVGDYDNDGLPDLYVNNFGPNVLYHNNGDGTFRDVTAKAGVGQRAKGRRRGPIFSTSTATAISISLWPTTSSLCPTAGRPAR